jgi:hypothetical protein
LTEEGEIAGKKLIGVRHIQPLDKQEKGLLN